MRNTYLYIFLLVITSCQSQTKRTERQIHVGGPCEGCEAIYEYGNKILTATDTLPSFHNNEPKIKISGTVFKKDGRTPASDVILYIYHTNREGIYQTNNNDTGWGRRHGFIRGWIKTDENGKYSFYTFRPAAYPDRQEPEHIHITVKESNKNEYYIDDYVFEDDTLLTKEKRAKLTNRGGSGRVTVTPLKNGIGHIQRDIILGLNIPDYE